MIFHINTSIPINTNIIHSNLYSNIILFDIHTAENKSMEYGE